MLIDVILKKASVIDWCEEKHIEKLKTTQVYYYATTVL